VFKIIHRIIFLKMGKKGGKKGGGMVVSSANGGED